MDELNMAYVLHGLEDLRCENCVAPGFALNEELVEVKIMGICGSDIHYYHHGPNWASGGKA